MITRAALHNWLFLAGYLTLLGAGLTFAWRLEPLSGNLTRIGSLAERDYGWHSPQLGLAEPHARIAALGESFDVTVLGDSTSIELSPGFITPVGRPTYHRWTDFLGAALGTDVGLYHLDNFSVAQITNGAGFRRQPPRLFVYEIGERTLRLRLGAHPMVCPAPTTTTARGEASLPAGADQLPGLMPAVRASREDWRQPQLGYGLDYLAHALHLRKPSSDALILPFNRPALFSSRRNDQVLIFQEEVSKAAWTDADWRGFACTLHAYRQAVEANGRTRFLLLIVPDKLSAYAPWISDPAYRSVSRLQQLMETVGVPLIRLDELVAGRIGRGDQDVYLPDDTHWDSNTQKAAAMEVFEWMRRQRLPVASGAGRFASGLTR